MQLFPFQQQTIDLFTDIQSTFIGDDMGLGKSAQAIILDVERRTKQPNLVSKPKTLVVTPLAMISTWVRYWNEWAPDLRVLGINNKDRVPFIKSIENDDHDVYIMHWPVLRLMPELADTKWFHIIADEAHSLQNRKSKQSIALKKMKTGYKTALSGTPAYDKPDDLWSILNWLYPKYWSSYWRFYNDHIIFTDYDGYRQIVGIQNVPKLHEDMSGFYIRRRKTDVALELPDKYYTEVYVDLNPVQRKAYEQMKRDMIAWIGEHEHEPLVAPVVIAQLIRLQQFACAYVEINEDGKARLSEPSTKLDVVVDIIESTAGQVVVFSAFSQAIDLLGKRLEKKGIIHGIYTGNTSATRRNDIIEGFQDGRIKVFAGTISAGGVGITLTAAQTVIFIDRSWQPSQNMQAEDRLHRIGQTNAVQVIDVMAMNTIDTRRQKDIQQKWAWLKEIIGD